MVEEEEKRISGARWRWLVDVARWRPSPAEFQAAAPLLPPHERPAIDSHSPSPPHDLPHPCTLEGKPYLQNKNVSFPSFNFNTSHQGDYVDIASEPLCLISLDIVCISKPQGETAVEFINNFTSYLTDNVWNCIATSGSHDEMLIEFYRYWCLKEAFVKATGAGVGFGLQRLEFHHINWTNISVCIDGKEASKWRFWFFKLDEMHLVICLPLSTPLQASIAKGHPDDAIDSFEGTFSDMVGQEEDLHTAIEIPEEAFALWTVEQLI